MKTSMEAKALAVALVLSGEPSTWGKPQADDAAKALQKMLAKGDIDPETFSQALTETCGNHSAMRQVLERHGMLAQNVAKPAWIIQCEKDLERITSEQADKAIAVPKETAKK